jgi:hypothetical protein
MDPAMLRRFHITVDFKALTKEGIQTLLEKFFKDYEFDEKEIEKLAAYDSVTPGDFSRLADTIKFQDADEITGPYILAQLTSIQHEKTGATTPHNRLGFCA